jgi:regulator of protease activity HflC (stomatin/prohibitin superfamily)
VTALEACGNKEQGARSKEHVEIIDIRLRKVESQASAASKDLQVVSTRVAVQYSLNRPVVPVPYQKIGRREIAETTLVNPAIMVSVKAVTAQHTAEQLVTARAEVKLQIEQAIESFIETTLAQKKAVGVLSLTNERSQRS